MAERVEMCPRLHFFFNDTATPEIYTLSLHDALPICQQQNAPRDRVNGPTAPARFLEGEADRKSTRLNSSHITKSYAVFCLKKKQHALESPQLLKKKKENTELRLLHQTT